MCWGWQRNWRQYPLFDGRGEHAEGEEAEHRTADNGDDGQSGRQHAAQRFDREGDADAQGAEDQPGELRQHGQARIASLSKKQRLNREQHLLCDSFSFFFFYDKCSSLERLYFFWF